MSTEARMIGLSLAALASTCLAVGSLAYSVSAEAATTFRWSKPTHRENGDRLTESEIGCYEIVGRNLAGAVTYRVTLPGGSTEIYRTDDPAVKNAVRHEISVCDTHGIFSSAVPIKPTDLDPPTGGGIKAPTGGGIR